MKTTKFKSIVKKGNNQGVGFISVSFEERNFFSINDQIRIILNSKIEFFSRIKFYGTIGFYVPYKIMVQNKLLGKGIGVEVKKIDGFFTSIGDDGRIYIPQNIAEKYFLKSGDITEIEFKTNNENIIKYCLIHFRKRKNTKEYMCMFDFKRPGQEGIFRLVRKLPKGLQNHKLPKELLKNFNFAEIDNKRVINYYGNRMPIIINSNININKIAHYLGCYFAIGTKRGNNWGICASTFEQTVYFKEMHNWLIEDARIVFSITYTDPKNENKYILENKLIHIWKKNTGIELRWIYVRIIPTKYKNAQNRNPYGSLIFKENRELTRIYYVRLLNFLLNKIKRDNDKQLALDFILGVLEGDGSVSAKKRGHVIITSNYKELKILEEIVKVTGINYKLYMEGKNKGYIRIWSLELIKNISILKDKLFKYYPKRRKILKKRLAQTGCSRFLLGKSEKTSNWLIGQLNNYEILDGKGNLTESGKKIQKDLKKFLLSKD
ncbi:MAG: hypothetical protein ABIC04_01045 [Nanoarchaeota archaeon]